MGVQSGPLTARPIMDLIYTVAIARSVTTKPPTSLSPVDAWELVAKSVKCDIAPLSDEIFFLQSGTENVATHVLHFYADQDIRVLDRVHFYTNRRLAGPVGSWYAIKDVMQPTESLAFVRCHAFITDAPKGVSV